MRVVLCDFAEIACPYASFGCTKRTRRLELSTHVQDGALDHNLLLLGQVKSLSDRVQHLEAQLLQNKEMSSLQPSVTSTPSMHSSPFGSSIIKSTLHSAQNDFHSTGLSPNISKQERELTEYLNSVLYSPSGTSPSPLPLTHPGAIATYDRQEYLSSYKIYLSATTQVLEIAKKMNHLHAHWVPVLQRAITLAQAAITTTTWGKLTDPAWMDIQKSFRSN